MTSYNRSQYIGAAIESVLAQTFTDFELLVVDDGSTDDSVAIARSYAARDARVHVHVNAHNLGDYPNRNHAARLATGEYLRYADSDDIQYPHCLAVLVPMLDAAPTALFALGGSRAWPGPPVPFLSSPRQSYQREFFGGGMFQIGPGGALIRREAFLKAGAFDDSRTTGSIGDYATWLRLCARHDALLVPADLFWYRTHEGQELNKPSHQRFADRARMLQWEALRTAPLSEAEREQARRNVAGRAARQIVRDIAGLRWKRALMRFTQSGLSFGEWLRYARRPRYMTPQ
jgi:glycosyltransferase involved in cell wall biosynthesis